MEKYLRDQLSQERTVDTLKDKIKQFQDENVTVMYANHDTQTTKMEYVTQCNNVTEMNSDYTLSSNTMNAERIDIAVDNKVNGETADSINKEDSKTDITD